MKYVRSALSAAGAEVDHFGCEPSRKERWSPLANEDGHRPLAEGVATLTAILLADETVESALNMIVELAAQTIPPVHAASASTVPVTEPGGVVATDDAVRQLDWMQHQCRRGPSLEALRTSRRVNAAVCDSRASWPEFTDGALKLGLQSVLAIPLAPGGHLDGVLVLFSRSREAFRRDQVEAAGNFARQAGVVLANVAALQTARTAQRQLEESLATRGLIGQAQGVLMARHNCSAERAFDLLRRSSQASNRKLRDVAAEIIGEHETGAYP